MKSIRLVHLLIMVLSLGAVPARAQITSIEDFATHAETSKYVLDYAIWSHFLNQYVFYNGFSDRVPGTDGDTLTGSRLKYGHRGRYSEEGNRVMFSLMRDGTRAALTAYREDLERISGEIDFTALSRDEQLAFWLNLHNAALIERLARIYPRTSLKQRHDTLFETKDLTVAGVPLSLDDIRLRIVYPHWRDKPYVMYGFWTGSVGGPSIQPTAFTAENQYRVLALTAIEFVNSLRGVDGIDGDTLRVSRLYEEARPYFFEDWPNALIAHLNRFAKDKVKPLLTKGRTVQADIYDWAIADLINGQAFTPTPQPLIARPGSVPGFPGTKDLAFHGQQFIRRSIERQRRMARERKGKVIIIDLEPDDKD